MDGEIENMFGKIIFVFQIKWQIRKRQKLVLLNLKRQPHNVECVLSMNPFYLVDNW